MNREFLINLLQKDIYSLEQSLMSFTECEEVLFDLEAKKISKRAKKYFYEHHRLNISEYELDRALQVIRTDYFIENERSHKVKEELENTKQAFKCLKYHQIVSNNLLKFLQKRLSREPLTDTDIIKLLELVRIENAYILKRSNSELITTNDLYLIFDMFNLGYEAIEVPEVENPEQLDALIPSIIEYLGKRQINLLKNEFHLDLLSSKDLEYLYTSVLKTIQSRIFELVEILKIKEFYFDMPTLIEIKNDYRKFTNMYLVIRKELDMLECSKEEDVSDDPEEEREDIYKLAFSTKTKDDPKKCYFIKDLLGIREDSLSEILKLLNDFKKGKTSRIKHLSGQSNFIELKDDQIRIVLKSIEDEYYSVQGVFIKKSDNDRDKYVELCARPIGIIDDEYSDLVTKVYEAYIEENKRKKSR